MRVVNESFNVVSDGQKPVFHTVTGRVKSILEKSGVTSGVCIVYSKHTTCAVIIDEDSIDMANSGLTYLQQDLADVFERLIPTCRREKQYMHPGPEMTVFAAEHGEEKPETLNTDAHLRSSILGRSESIPIINGNLDLGDFGHIYFVDFDHTRTRERTVTVQIIGE